MLRKTLIVCIALSLPAAALADTTLSGDAGKAWKTYQKKRGYKAFASNGGEAWGYSWKAKSKQQAEMLAVGSCREKLSGGTAPCELLDSSRR